MQKQATMAGRRVAVLSIAGLLVVAGCSSGTTTGGSGSSLRCYQKASRPDGSDPDCVAKNLPRKLDCDTFFADAYSPWQRGSNENCNGLVRDFAPRNRDFSKLSHQFVAAAANNLNHRPRKCLGFRTPHEVLFGLSPVGFRT